MAMTLIVSAIPNVATFSNDTWHGYTADTTDDDARADTARRLGCARDEVEVKRSGGAVLARQRRKRKGDQVNDGGKNG